MTMRGTIVSLGFAITVAACSGSPAPAPSTQPAPAATPRPAAAMAPPTATPVAVAPPTYERKGRRDPFQPIEIVQDVEIKLAVASARLTGIVRGSATLALVEMPDGMGYIMQPGDTLAEGRLIEIGTDNVVFSVPARKGSRTSRLFLRLPSD
jgi:hypothetical protein